MDGSFKDRLEAGERLANALLKYRGANAIILGLPRGGVVVGYQVSQALQLPLSALVVRKLGAPENPELGIGAVSETGTRWVDYVLAREVGATESYIQRETAMQTAEAGRRKKVYGTTLLPADVRGKSAIVVDDGIATGATALVGVQSARALGASRVILATPLTSPQAEQTLQRHVDQFVALARPDPFLAVGLHYERFGQVEDSEVIQYLERARQQTGAPAQAAVVPVPVDIPAGSVTLPGFVSLPSDARGIVLFAHGSGSGRFSPRNTFVAEQLQAAGLGTLLVDLLTADEAMNRELVFDIKLLADRLLACTAYIRRHEGTRDLHVGYFGASTGAAAALVAAARLPTNVKAVVSRGGRPDLAGDALSAVRCPTLLLVGGNDFPVIPLNKDAASRMVCEREVVIVPGATHLFEEAGALETVAGLARQWFQRTLVRD